MEFVQRADGSALRVIKILGMIGKKLCDVVVASLFRGVLAEPYEIEYSYFLLFGNQWIR